MVYNNLIVKSDGQTQSERDLAQVANELEGARLTALSRYEILNTPSEEAFDRITELASRIFGVPVVLISLVDQDRQWFKSCHGLDVRETDRSLSFCAHAIQEDAVMVVPDATQDARFALNALVTGEPGIRFYAGAPLQTPDGHKLGTLCLIDKRPRSELTRQQREMLESLAALVVDELELRRVAKSLHTSESQLRAIVETTSDAIYSKDTEGRYLFINRVGAALLGRGVDEVLGKRDGELLNSEDNARITAMDRRVMLAYEPLSYEHTARYKGEERTFFTQKYPYRSDQGDVLGLIGESRDITEYKRAEQALAESEARHRIVAETASDVLVTIDETNIILYLNPAAEKIFGHRLEDMLGQNLNMLMPEYLRHVHAAGLKRYRETGRKHISWGAVEVPGLHKNGHEIDLEISFGEHKQEGRHLFTAIIRDITERKRAEEALRRTTALLQAAFDSTAEGVLSVDEHGRITNYNRRYLEMWRVPEKVIDAQVDETLVQHAKAQLKEPTGFLERVQDAYKDPESETRDEFELRDGRIIERVSLPQRVDDRIVGRVWSFRDVTERYRAEERLQEANRELEARVAERTTALKEANRELTRLNERLLHDAFHDSLTGLPNRALFADRLRQAIERYNARVDYGFSVLFLDSDRFKIINDSLGHTVGDQLLVAIAERLSKCVRPRDTVARLGGDEFTILMEDVTGVEQATGTAERIQRELSRPFVFEGQTVYSSVSIGITSSALNYEQPGDVLRDADIAMYRAKALGKATYQVFTPEMRERAASLLTLENDLRRAIERQELRVHYQPIVTVVSGRLVGFEALLRWQHPRLGMVSRAEFMPVAEETGLVIEFDRWVLHEACRQVREWQDVLPLTLNVNLSGQALVHAGLAESVDAILAETGFDPRNLRLELTESVLVHSSEKTHMTLSRLKSLGVQLYIDDFGTGYSSLSYLQRLPIDALKIDGSFIQRMTQNPESAELVKTILAMARNLGLQVVAEGVETARQLKRLERLRCPYAQGYFFAKPLGAEEAATFLEAEVLRGQIRTRM